MPRWTRISVALALGAVLALQASGPAVGSDARDVKKQMDAALKKRDKSGALDALKAASALDGDKGAKLLVDRALHLAVIGLVDELVDGMASVKDAGPIIKAAKRNRKEDIRYLAVRALGRLDSKEAIAACREALEDKSEAVAVAAVRATQNQPDSKLVDTYISMLEEAEKAKGRKVRDTLHRELITALQNLSGKDMEAHVDWSNWWKAHRDSWKWEKTGEKGDDDSVIGRMKKHRKSDLKTLERLGKTDIICVRGSSDRVQEVLEAIEIEHSVVRREELFKNELKPSSVLILNCNGNKDQFSDQELAKLSKFVAEGGYLFSSDWELKFTIEKAFPGTIGFAGESERVERGKEKAEMIRPLVPNHPYMRDVFPLSTVEQLGFKWKIDGRSHLVKILGRGAIFPLVQCPALEKKHKAGVVAVTFRWDGSLIKNPKRAVTGAGSKPPEGGSVLHVLGHFKNQKDKSDKFALQQLLLNFILEKQREKKLAK